MTKIYSSSQQEIYYDNENSILKNVWLVVDISFDEMKAEMKNWMDKFNEKRPKLMLTDSSNGTIVPVETQEWIIGFLFPTVIEKGVLKYAIIMSEEVVAELSVEQMFDEIRDKPTGEFQQFNFENETGALNWLKK